MNWDGHSSGEESAFSVGGLPVWVKGGIAVVGALVLVLLAIVLLAPSAPSQKVALTTLAPPTAPTVTTLAPGALDTRGGIGVTRGTLPPAQAASTTQANAPHGGCDPDDPGCAASLGCHYDSSLACHSSPPTTAAPQGLRDATSSEISAIAPEVPPPSGQRIDAVQISLSDGTWGLLHVAAGSGRAPEWILIHRIGARWAAVDSGYPQLPCYRTISPGVAQDLTGRMAGCS